MRNFIAVIALIFFSFGCTSQNTAPKTMQEKLVTNTFITDDKGDQSDTFKASINKIRVNGTSLKLQRSTTNNKDVIIPILGQAEIQIECTFRGYYNFHWIKVTLEEGKHYAAYCVGDTAEALIGKKADALYAFVSTQKDMISDKTYNQAIINTPPIDSLNTPIPSGKTRVIVFNKKSTVLGFDNSFPHSISIDNQYKEIIYPNKYVVLDIPNGSHVVKLEYTDVFRFKKEVSVELKGNSVYLESVNGASSITANILESAPNQFTTTYKPNDLRKYFKQNL